MAAASPPAREASVIEEFLIDVEMLRAEDPKAALEKLEAAPGALSGEPEVRLLHADLSWELQGASAARPELEALVAAVPDYADARHMLGCVYDELGLEKSKVEQFLEVLKLDEGLDHELEGVDERELEDLIVRTAEEAVARLPEPFRTKLAGVPILVEARPGPDLVHEGFDPRALGLFEGPTHLDHENAEASATPTRIALYSANLLAESVDENQLCAEVETTVFHEVGHYFGLDEDDLTRIGLD
jgi:predicted Zn-dependent protease with MMP-like domain